MRIWMFKYLHPIHGTELFASFGKLDLRIFKVVLSLWLNLG